MKPYITELVPLPDKFALKVTPPDTVKVSAVKPLVTVNPPFRVTASDSVFWTKLASTVEDRLDI
jgi:hypothetical protein